MEVHKIPRVICEGDVEAASLLAREGMKQLNILKSLMKFDDLKQDIRKVIYTDGSRIVCRSCFGEDVVHIYVPEKEEEREEFSMRFYCLLVDEVFKWIVIIVLDDGSYGGVFCIKITGASNIIGNPFGMMVDRPYFDFNGCAKSFMLDDERYVASHHLLIYDRKILYEADMMEYCDAVAPIYLPCQQPPASWAPRCTDEDGNPVGHYTTKRSIAYPSNRFLVNNDLLTWYHSREGYIFGKCIKLEEREEEDDPDSMRTPTVVHNLYSRWFDGSSHDIANGGDIFQIQVGIVPKVPVNMVSDIVETTEEYIEHYIDYEYLSPVGGTYYTIRRPIKVKKFIDPTKDTTYKMVEGTEHWYWSDSGFEKKEFFTLSEHPDEGLKTLIDSTDSWTLPFHDCVGYGNDQAACAADHGHAMIHHEDHEFYLKQVHYLTVLMDISFFDWSSDYDRTKENLQDLDKIGCNDSQCFISYLLCAGPSANEFDAHTAYTQDRENNVANALRATWESGNVAKISQKGTVIMTNCRNSLSAKNDLQTKPWPWEEEGLIHEPWWSGRCKKYLNWGARSCANPGCYGEVSNSNKSYLGGGTAQWWKEKITPFTETLETVSEYDFDGKKQVPVSEVEKYWYLDDLATEESQGLMLTIKKSDGNIEFHHRFSGEVTYRDITQDVFRALDLVDENGVLLKDKIIEVGLI